jgi:hypothetical protein
MVPKSGIESLQPANVLSLLTLLVQGMAAGHYKQPLPVLSLQSVGAHSRHVIEFYQCLRKGIEAGRVCYEDRIRDTDIETEKQFALDMLHNLMSWCIGDDKPIVLQVGSSKSGNRFDVQSSLLRELHYVAEHTIHHLALIRIGANALGYATAENFGIAPSTLEYRGQCVS